MIWSLYLDIYRSGLTVMPENPLEGDSHYILLSQRDPEIPLEFKIGGYYFNPLFREGGVLHPYIVNGDVQLVSVFTGKGPKKFSKDKTAMYNRGWFELPPQPIKAGDIHPDLRALINSQPRLHGAIAQLARGTMNLRIPDGLAITDTDGWLDWIATQKTPLPLRLRQVFQVLQVRPASIEFDDKLHHQLLTGEIPEPICQIKLRWYDYSTLKILRRQIKESVDWELELPISVIQEGEAAILAAADIKFGASWREVSAMLPTGVTDTEVPSDPEATIAGSLIWFRVKTAADLPFVPLGPKFEGEHPTSINDLFQIAIQST
jgi:hypothetical protein